MAEWIDVKKQIPEPRQSVIGYSRWGHISILTRRGYDSDGKAYAVGGLIFGKDILYWQPLPEPPKGGAGE